MEEELSEKSTTRWRDAHAYQPPVRGAQLDWQAFLARNGLQLHPRHHASGAPAFAVRNAVLSAGFIELRMTHAIPPLVAELRDEHFWEIYSGLTQELPDGVDEQTVTHVLEWFFAVAAEERGAPGAVGH